MIEQVNLIYYSPTGTSRKIARAIGDGLKINKITEIDLTFNENIVTSVDSNTLNIFAVPVYGGRLPKIFLERLGNINGNNALCSIVVVYGNRHYDDALLELKNELLDRGFKPVSAATFIGEHSYSTKEMPVAQGRPDLYDLGMAEHFGKETIDKILSVKDYNDLIVPGNYPYKELKPSPKIAPVSTEDCCSCGECIGSCPTHAIDFDSEGKIHTDIDKCTKCCACVKVCPIQARKFDTPFTKFLYDNFRERKLPEFYF